VPDATFHQIGAGTVQILAGAAEYLGKLLKRGWLYVELSHCRSPMKLVVRREVASSLSQSVEHER